MKSLSIPSFIFLFCISIIHAQEIEEGGYIEIETKRIKESNIKSIKEESDCYVNQEEPPYKFEDCDDTIEEKYDENGHILSIKVFEDRDLAEIYTYTYKANQLVSKKEDFGDGISKTTYDYNASEQLIEKKEYDNNTLEYQYKYAYNTQGLITEKEYIALREDSGSFGGTTYSKTQDTYTSTRKCTSETEYRKDGSEKNKIIYEYSNNERTVVEKEKRDKNTYVSQYANTYDSKGNVTEKILYDYYGKQEQRRVRTYDTHNNILTYEEYNENNALSQRTTYTYNAQNDPIKKIVYRPRTSYTNKEEYYNTVRYSYEYDTHENWTTKVSIEDDDDGYDLTDEIKRTIKYHK